MSEQRRSARVQPAASNESDAKKPKLGAVKKAAAKRQADDRLADELEKARVQQQIQAVRATKRAKKDENKRLLQGDQAYAQNLKSVAEAAAEAKLKDEQAAAARQGKLKATAFATLRQHARQGNLKAVAFATLRQHARPSKAAAEATAKAVAFATSMQNARQGNLKATAFATLRQHARQSKAAAEATAKAAEIEAAKLKAAAEATEIEAAKLKATAEAAKLKAAAEAAEAAQVVAAEETAADQAAADQAAAEQAAAELQAAQVAAAPEPEAAKGVAPVEPAEETTDVEAGHYSADFACAVVLQFGRPAPEPPVEAAAADDDPVEAPPADDDPVEAEQPAAPEPATAIDCDVLYETTCITFQKGTLEEVNTQCTTQFGRGVLFHGLVIVTEDNFADCIGADYLQWFAYDDDFVQMTPEEVLRRTKIFANRETHRLANEAQLALFSERQERAQENDDAQNSTGGIVISSDDEADV